MSTARTPSQTIGPYFAVGLPWDDGPFVVPEGTAGAIWIRGQVFDGQGDPIPDAMVETWQADPAGRFDHPDDPRGAVAGFRGFGRCCVDDAGGFAVLTLKPGRIHIADGPALAPHIDVSVFARGLLKRVVTRMYFADEEAANEEDPVLADIGDPDERATLIAERTADGYRFDVRLQGSRETVFFAL